jgi:membrane protease YdiL (CAAX protease family)
MAELKDILSIGKKRISAIKIIAPLIPYICVGTGLLLFHNAWIAMLSYHIGMIIILFIVSANIPIKLLFKSNDYRIPLITAILGASGGILMYLLWPLLNIPPNINSYVQNIGLNEATWPCFLMYFILVNPFIEEYFWRGYLGGDSKKFLLNDLLFSGYHVIVLAGKMSPPWLIAIFLILACSAWFWRQTNYMSRGLLSSTISHFLADVTVIFTIYSMVIRT